ncbi:MAG: hypothetical protein JO095_17665 [Alphaproteobacteria bacterium]|nr:hypothetical protein [Alphaproteobacteria bacterium]
MHPADQRFGDAFGKARANAQLKIYPAGAHGSLRPGTRNSTQTSSTSVEADQNRRALVQAAATDFCGEGRYSTANDGVILVST